MLSVSISHSNRRRAKKQKITDSHCVSNDCLIFGTFPKCRYRLLLACNPALSTAPGTCKALCFYCTVLLGSAPATNSRGELYSPVPTEMGGSWTVVGLSFLSSLSQFFTTSCGRFLHPHQGGHGGAFAGEKLGCRSGMSFSIVGLDSRIHLESIGRHRARVQR